MKYVRYAWEGINKLITFILIVFIIIASAGLIKAKKNNTEPEFLGYRPILVLTGSMEETMKEKSVVIVKSKDYENALIKPAKINKNDIIMFEDHKTSEFEANDKNDGKQVTQKVLHRLIDINEDGTLVTKGDNNRRADINNITMDNVRGKVVLIINWAAKVITTWQYSTQGKMIIIFASLSIIIALMLLEELMEMLFRKYDPTYEEYENKTTERSHYEGKAKEESHYEGNKKGEVIAEDNNNERLITEDIKQEEIIVENVKEENKDTEEDNNQEETKIIETRVFESKGEYKDDIR